MTSYLPRFTLRRAMIGIALLALFLGWLRPDRADIRSGISVPPMWTIRFRPVLCPDSISIARFDYTESVEWRASVETNKSGHSRPPVTSRP